jgi:hypothetical protein
VRNVSLPLKETCAVFSVLRSMCIVGVYRKRWLSFASACVLVVTCVPQASGSNPSWNILIVIYIQGKR